ncbi:MAG: MarR family transcriptional regulator [Bacteroidota bacterium]
MQEIRFENTVLPCLGKTAKLAGFYFTDMFHENNIDLSKEQWLVLKKLHDNDGMVQNDLAFITDRSKTSLSRLIQTMEKRDYVVRVHSKSDKRINHVFLTQKGKDIFIKSLPVLNQIMSELTCGISRNDLESTVRVLHHIQENINKKENK